MKQSNYQKQSQQQKQGYYLSQQHLKLMHLMHLSGYALQEYLTNEVEQNPALEMENEPDAENEEGKEKEMDEFTREMLFNDDDLFEKNYKSTASENPYEAPVVQYNSLHENLKEQIHMQNLDPLQTEIACYLVDELNDDGFLTRSIGDVADDFSFNKGKPFDELAIESALKAIQLCEPAGVGAANIRECLLLQLKRKASEKNETIQAAIRLLEEHYDVFSQNNFERLLSLTGLSQEDLDKCIRLISRLNPKPVTEATRYELFREHIIPDFEVTIDEDDLYVSLTQSDYSKLRVNPDFESYKLNTEKESQKKQAENYFQHLLNDANTLVGALRERENTMMRVMKKIVSMQPQFFHSGDIKVLRPMILQDIAEATGYDISTVSRITSNKYVQTPHGVFPIKNLFMRAINSDLSGNSSTAISIQEEIQKLVNAEDKSDPMSDIQIAAALKSKGIRIARRTVVKYREAIDIPNSTVRKKEKGAE